MKHNPVRCFGSITSVLLTTLLTLFCTATDPTINATALSADTLLIKHTTTAPQIDGVLDGLWIAAAPQPLTELLAGAAQDPDAFSGEFRMLYDAAHLYLFVEIADDVSQFDSGAEWWMDDGVELYVDGDHSAGSSYDGVNDAQLGFRRGDSTLHLNGTLAAPLSTVVAAQVETATGAHLEVALPLATLDINPVAGHIFGFDLHLNDDDDGGERDRKLAWHATVDDSWENPGRFGAAQLLAPATSPTVRQWQPAGFGGAGAFLSLHFDPVTPGVVYATSDVAGVFRSTDNGDSWTLRSVDLGNYEVSSFAVDPFDPQTLYAGVGAFAGSSKGGIYVSRDAGVTWTHLSATAANRIDFRVHRTPNAIALDPFQQGIMLSGSRTNGIWRSTDSGASWSQVLAPVEIDLPLFFSLAGGSVVDPLDAPYPAPVTVVRFDPTTRNLVYAAVYGVGVFKSTDGGRNWQARSVGLPGEPTLHDLIIAPNGTLYSALGAGGIYRSMDGGATWQAVNSGIPLNDFLVLSLAVHPTAGNQLYFAQERVDQPTNFHPPIWQSSDGGATWQPLSENVTTDPVNSPPDRWWFAPSSSWRVTVDPHNPNRLFYLVGGIYRSEDGGVNWRNVIRGAQDTCVTDLLVDRDHPIGEPDTLYATHMDAGLLASTDNGATWEMLVPNSVEQRTALAGHYWRIATARVEGVKFFYTTAAPWLQPHHQLLRSTDGRNWDPVFTATVPDGDRGLGQLSLAIDPTNPRQLYLAPDGGTLSRSVDSGNSWNPTAGQPNASRFNDIVVDHAGRLFASTFFEGLWRSGDGGATWQQVFAEQSLLWDLAAVPGAIYVTAGDGNLYRSEDGGTTWHNLTNLTPVADDDGTTDQGITVAINPDDANHLIFSRYDVWHSADRGAGLLESRDGGVTWQPFNRGLGVSRVSVFAFGRNGQIFAGTHCGGIWRTDVTTTAAGERTFLPLVLR